MLLENVKQLTIGKKNYPIAFEIAGDFAMFSRPDAGSEEVSYSAPTFSAAKGMIESILYIPDVYIIPRIVEICNPIQYQKWSFNYNGIFRKNSQINNDNVCQIRYLVLRNVCYKIYASIVNKSMSPINPKYENINSAHAFMDRFNRRLKRGQSFRTPHLGISEFLPSYFGELREETSPCKHINQILSSMLFANFDKLNNGDYSPVFKQNVEIRNGVLNYVE